MKNLEPKIVIETQYLPTIAFYSYVYNTESLSVEKWENYQKGSFRNRCSILSAQGILTLSIPLLSGKNEQQSIQSVKIDNGTNWAKIHLRSIRSCYGNAPYFDFYINVIEEILIRKWEYLFDLNNEIICKIGKVLNIESKFNTTKKFVKSYPENISDLRNFISPKNSKKNKLKRDFDFKPYDQVFSELRPFEPNLSILDLLFCKGPESPLYLKQIHLNKRKSEE